MRDGNGFLNLCIFRYFLMVSFICRVPLYPAWREKLAAWRVDIQEYRTLLAELRSLREVVSVILPFLYQSEDKKKKIHFT